MNRIDQNVRSYALNDDEIDLRELFEVIWKGKIVISLCTLICASIAVSYAFMAQEWWTAKAKVTAPLTQDYISYFNQVSQLQAIVGNRDQFGQLQVVAGQLVPSNDIDLLKDSNRIFDVFIEEFNLGMNKQEFFKNVVQQKSNQEAVVVGGNLLATAEDKRQIDSAYVLSFQTTDMEASSYYLEMYVEFVENKSRQRIYADLQSLVSAKRSEFEQERAVLLAEAQAKQDLEILRTKLALEIAQGAEIESPIPASGEKLFPVELGVPALLEKLEILQKNENFSLFQPEIDLLNAKITILNQVIKNQDAQFSLFRALESVQQPINRDKPKRLLIAVLGTLLGGMLGVALVLMRHAFGRKEETV